MRQGKLLPHLRSPNGEHLVVSALASELPEALPETVLFTGVGKINATYALTRYLAGHPEIRTVIIYGTGGDLAKFKDDGAVELYNDGSLKLATTSTGVDISGQGVFKVDSHDQIKIGDASLTNFWTLRAGTNLLFKDNGTERMPVP